MGERQELTLDRTAVHHRAHTHTHPHSQFLNQPSVYDSGPLEETGLAGENSHRHVGTRRAHRKGVSPGGEDVEDL